MHHHSLFHIDEEKLCTERSLYYLRCWVDTFNALRRKALRNYCPSPNLPVLDQDTDTLLSSKDSDEYLVDINDGMDLEDSMANAGNCDVLQQGDKVLDSAREVLDSEGVSSETPWTSSVSDGRSKSPMCSAREELDGEGVSSETPWTSSPTDSRSTSPQHMGRDEVNHERIHKEIHDDGSLNNGEMVHSAETRGTIEGKYTLASGGIGKHGRTASPIAEKPPWN